MDAPKGDPAAQAVASLHGYAYQLYASGLAWLDLKPQEILYLEVAKDYAVAAGNALDAVEVKNTSASVTINSEDVRETLDGFVDLAERNPGRAVHLRFLSTSAIGREKAKEDRAAGEPTLNYWRRAAAGADVEPLRAVLKKAALTPRVQAYIDARDNEALRSDFLRHIHWDCGAQSLEGVIAELQSGLARYASERLGAHSTPRERLSSAVLQRILATVISANRRLVDTDLLTEISTATSITVPQQEFEELFKALAKKLGNDQGSDVTSATSPRVLEPENDVPLPSFLAERKTLIADIHERARSNGVAVVTGSSGSGKTVLARLTARLGGKNWSLIDLRDLDALEMTQRLDYALGQLGLVDRDGVILDDFNELEDPVARRALTRFLAAMKRRDNLCLITAYREPSTRTFTELGIDKSAQVTVPDLSVEEVTEIVTHAGADGKKWGRLVYLAGAFGHPLLVQAEIMGLRARSWSDDDFKRLRALKESEDVTAERLATRQRLVNALPNDARSLLYRASLLIGRFDRKLVLSLGQVEPPISEAGAELDLLIGPWVEQAGSGNLRLSPLLQGAGEQVLTADVVEKLYKAAAEHIFAGRNIDIDKANPAFMYALRGRSEETLKKIAFSVISAKQKTHEMLSEWLTTLRLHRTDKPIFADNNRISVLLRLAQFSLVGEKKDRRSIRNCWAALQKEIKEIDDAEFREHYEYISIAKALIDQSVAGHLPNWVQLILRFKELVAADPERKETYEKIKPPPGVSKHHTTVGMFFILQSMGLETIAELKEVFGQLDALKPETRQELLADVARMPNDYSLIVNRPWLQEAKREDTNWNANAEMYLGMAKQAQGWGYRELALRCHVSRAVIFDEYLKLPAAAVKALDEAKAALGDSFILKRALGKIEYRRNEYKVALSLLRECLSSTEINEPIERTYMLREGGISAAQTDDWPLASRLFAEGATEAAKARSSSMRPMEIGMKADAALAAYKSNEIGVAVEGLDGCLNDLEKVDPSSSITGGFVHRIIRHAVLWLYGEATGTAMNVDEVPTAMIPGMCSNPQPFDLNDMPLGAADYARYMLACIEAQLGLPTGVGDALKSRLKGRGIPGMELMLRNARLKRAVATADAQALIHDAQSMVDGQNFLDKNRARLMQEGPLNPSYEEIPTITDSDSQNPNVVFTGEDSFLAFGIHAALSQKQDALNELGALIDSYPARYAGAKLVQGMIDGLNDGTRVEEYTANEIHRVAKDNGLTADELFTACVRFLQTAKRSNFQKLLTPLILRWAKAKWNYVLDEQRFYLVNPTSTVPAIRDALNRMDGKLSSLGRLLVAAEPSVKQRLSQDFRDYLTS
jgi:hypothetical protein